MFNNIDFHTYVPKASDIKQTWPLSEVKQQLGLSAITMHNNGNGNFVIFRKADGTSTTMPCSRKMTAQQFPNARLALMADGKTYIIIRPEGESTLETLAKI